MIVTCATCAHFSVSKQPPDLRELGLWVCPKTPHSYPNPRVERECEHFSPAPVAERRARARFQAAGDTAD